MDLEARSGLLAVLSGIVLLLAGCDSSRLLPPETHGPPLMVDDAGQPRLWVMTKQEEEQMVGVGGGRRNTGSWRTDTYFHFAVQAFDPRTARPLWKQRLLTIGDPEARDRYRMQTRVIGSAVGAKLLGQDGGIVWLLIGDAPFAVKASDGTIVSDPDTLQQEHPQLKGLLPSEAQHYGFDRGLVVMAADARQWVVRGGQPAQAYVPTPEPSAYPEGRLYANGRRGIVPMYPLVSEIPVRLVELDGKLLGLYSEKEAADAANDQWGDKLLYPYSIDDEGKLARRTFWRPRTVEGRSFDDRFERFEELLPIPGAPTYLKGRFLKDLGTGLPGTALLLEDPAGVLVLHSTRMDDAGRVALARLDQDLKERWKSELPLSETDIINPLTYWQLPGHVVLMGQLQTEDAGVTRRELHLVSVELQTGAVQSWNMEREAEAGAGTGAEG